MNTISKSLSNQLFTKLTETYSIYIYTQSQKMMSSLQHKEKFYCADKIGNVSVNCLTTSTNRQRLTV